LSFRGEGVEALKSNLPGAISVSDHLIARELALASGMTLMSLESTFPFKSAPPSIVPNNLGVFTNEESKIIKDKTNEVLCVILNIYRAIYIKFLSCFNK
jgi:hypothetical protein